MKGIQKNANQILFKIIVIGESGTGKSCLMIRYVKQSFSTEYNVTVGVEFGSRSVKIDENCAVKLQIWDTAGQESFRSIIKNFYRNTSAVFLVYDITKKKTFEGLNSWLKEARQNITKNRHLKTQQAEISTAVNCDVMYILIGTHLDRVQEDESLREVERTEAENWMRTQRIDLFFETSAKTDIGVTDAFNETANQLFLNYIKVKSAMKKKDIEEKPIVVKKDEPVQKKKCCESG